ncbi:proline--tRNA ligase, partial [Patescibacteria group bacterium]|nr:proline--tRNA ligase [Patescibacteria group bacterium]
HYHTKNANWGRDIEKPEQFYDLKIARDGDLYPETGEKYETFKVCEVGNIFPLYTKFSKAFDYKYMDISGKPQEIFMGCYGIGSSRVMGVIAEKSNDDNGLIWPANIAPLQVQLIALNLDDEEIKTKAFELYEKLEKQGIEVLFDDRLKASPGEKFSDADLIGNPIRLVISRKTEGKVEFRKRTEKESEMLNIEDVVEKIKTVLKSN